MQCWRVERLDELLCGNLENVEEPHQLIKEGLIDAIHLLHLVTGGERLIVAIEPQQAILFVMINMLFHLVGQTCLTSFGVRWLLVEFNPLHVRDELLAVLQQI